MNSALICMERARSAETWKSMLRGPKTGEVRELIHSRHTQGYIMLRAGSGGVLLGSITGLFLILSPCFLSAFDLS